MLVGLRATDSGDLTLLGQSVPRTSAAGTTQPS